MAFLSFVIATAFLGGDTFNGYEQGGHYFVCLHVHGPCAEVSRQGWEVSRWHVLATAGAILLVMIECAIFVNTGDLELGLGRRR